MSKLFSNSKRLNHIIRFLKDFFPQIEFEGIVKGLRLVVDGEDFSEDSPKSMLRVESEYYNYIINTYIDYEESDSDNYDSTATVESPSLMTERILTLPLASLVQETEAFIYEGDFSEICTLLFHDLRYGEPLEEDVPIHPYLLPLVSAYHSNSISELFTVAEREEDKNLYIFDDKISFESFKSLIINEFNDVISIMKKHLEKHYPKEYFIQWQELSTQNSIECFLIIDKYLDKKTAERLADYVDDAENYEKLMSLTESKAFPVTRLCITFTKDVVIISVPNKIISDGDIELDTSQLVSSYLISRDGYLPKEYAVNSIRSCITDVVSAVMQIIIRDADIDGIDDLGNIIF